MRLTFLFLRLFIVLGVVLLLGRYDPFLDGHVIEREGQYETLLRKLENYSNQKGEPPIVEISLRPQNPQEKWSFTVSTANKKELQPQVLRLLRLLDSSNLVGQAVPQQPDYQVNIRGFDSTFTLFLTEEDIAKSIQAKNFFALLRVYSAAETHEPEGSGDERS